MLCIPGVTPDGRRDNRQGVGCGKVVLKYLRNTGTSRCVSIEATSASIFSTPVMWEMGEWIIAWLVIHAALRRIGPVVVGLLTLTLTLTRLAQLSVAEFPAPVVMCSSGAMRGAKRWR